MTQTFGRESLLYFYDMLQRPLRTESIDGGKRWMLTAVDAQPVRRWDSRNQVFDHFYDALRRPTYLKMPVGYQRDPSTPLPPDDFPTPILIETLYGDTADMSSAERLTATVANLIGQPMLVKETAGTLAFEAYNHLGLLTSQLRKFTQQYYYMTDWSGEVALETSGYLTSTKYDALGRPTQVKHPDQTELNYHYQQTGQLKQVIDGAGLEHLKLATYNPKGQRQRVRHGNNITTDYAYDPATFRLTEIKSYVQNQENNPIQHLQYHYDAVGNIVKVTNLREPGTFYGGTFTSSDSTYIYDPMYRLVQAIGREHLGQTALTELHGDTQYFQKSYDANDALAWTAFKEIYEYDAVGNITKLRHRDEETNGAHFTRRYRYEGENNHLLDTVFGSATPGTTYTYDPHGNCTGMPGLPIMNWDCFDRLASSAKQVNQNGFPETTFYQYDSQGNRLRKIKVQAINNGYPFGSSGLTVLSETRYLGEFEEFWKKTGTQPLVIFSKTIHISDETGRFALIENDGTNVLTRYQHTNHLGSSSLETDSAGVVISYEEYHPFGTTAYQATLNTLGYSAKRYRFCGKEKDEESGLYYYGARYYASWLGRFVSVDPKESKYFFQSSYAYAENSPVVKMDWNGEGTGEEKPKEHEIKKGDTFWNLENKYGLKHGILSNLNPTLNPSNLKIGEKIRLSNQNKIIFVNGNIGFGSPPAGEEFWSGSSFLEGATSFFRSKNVYFTKEDYGDLSRAKDRFSEGEVYAKENLSELTKDLNKDIDKINFVTHSMGAAFAEGMIKVLGENNFKIGTVVHINAYQAADISTSDTGVFRLKTIDYQNIDDPVIKTPLMSSPGDIKGVDLKIREMSGVYNGNTPVKDMILNRKGARSIHMSPIWNQGSNFWKKF